MNRVLFVLAVTAAAGGCSGGAPEPPKLIGSFGVRSAIFNTIFPNGNDEYTAIRLLDFDGACDKAMRAEHAPGSSNLQLALSQRLLSGGSSAVSGPDTYPVHAKIADSTTTTQVAEFERFDGNCMTALSLDAEAGQVVIERVDATTIAGTYDLSQFGGFMGTNLTNVDSTSDVMKGSFVASVCPAFQLTQECF
jgi:hypothetical protein